MVLIGWNFNPVRYPIENPVKCPARYPVNCPIMCLPGVGASIVVMIDLFHGKLPDRILLSIVETVTDPLAQTPRVRDD
jgi:hypothetical protein